LFIATYMHGKALNCVNECEQNELATMKNLWATQMFPDALLYNIAIRTPSGDNEIHNMVCVY
jgi:hypothetical protein